MTSSRNLLFTLLFVIVLLITVSGIAWVSHRYVVNNRVGAQFETDWTAAQNWVVNGVTPYSYTTQKTDLQLLWQRVFPGYQEKSTRLFIYPLYSMLFFAPLGILNIQTARVIGMTGLAVVMVTTSLILIRLMDWKPNWSTLGGILVYTLLGYSAIYTIQTIDLTPLSMLPVFAALLLIKNKRDTDAGLIMSLSTIYLQTVYPLILFTLLWAFSAGRLKLALGLLGGIIFLVIVSIVFLPQWPLQWFSILIHLPPASRPSISMVNVITALMPAISKPLSIGLSILGAGYLVVEWVLCWGKDFRNFMWTALLTIVLTGFFIPQYSIAFQLMFIPVLILVIKTWQERWGQLGRILSWVLLGGTFLLPWALALYWNVPLESTGVLIVLAPLASLLALWWTRWWMIRIPKLYFDQIGR